MHQIAIFERERPTKEMILECGDSLMLGRSRDCDLFFNQPDVSRYHARVDHRFNGLVLVIESRSGAQLNGETVYNEVGLADGDTLELGEAVKIEVSKFAREGEGDVAFAKTLLRPSDVCDTMTMMQPVLTGSPATSPRLLPAPVTESISVGLSADCTTSVQEISADDEPRVEPTTEARLASPAPKQDEPDRANDGEEDVDEDEDDLETGLFELGTADDEGEEEDPDVTGFWEPPTETILFDGIAAGGVEGEEEEMGQTIVMNPVDLQEEERKVIVRLERKKTMRTMGKLALCLLPVLILIAYLSRDTIILDQRVDWPKERGRHLMEFREVQPGIDIICPKVPGAEVQETAEGLKVNSRLPGGLELFHIYAKETQKRFLGMSDQQVFRWWADKAERAHGLRPDMKLVQDHFLKRMDGGAGVPVRHFPHTAQGADGTEGGRVGWTLLFRHADELHTLRLEVGERDAYRAEELLRSYRCIRVSEEFERQHWVPIGESVVSDESAGQSMNTFSILGDISRDLRVGGTGQWPQILKDLRGILAQSAERGDQLATRKATGFLISLRNQQASWYNHATHQLRKGGDRDYWTREIQRLFGGGQDVRGVTSIK